MTHEHDGQYCFDCAKAIRKILLDIYDLVEELEIQVTRQNVAPRQPGGTGTKDEFPILFDQRASEVTDLVLETLGQWTGEVTRRQPAATTCSSRYERARLLTQHLATCALELSLEPGIQDELRYLRSRVLKVIDIQPGTIPIGACGCGEVVRARARWQDNEWVYPPTTTCRGCGQLYDVATSRAKLQERGREQLVTAQEAVALGEIAEGVQFKEATIRNWVRRGHLEVRETDPVTRQNKFRFSDLLALAARSRVKGQLE